MTPAGVWYLAGPMTGLPEYNYPLFHACAAELREHGWQVRSPAEIDYREDLRPRGSLPAGVYLRAGLAVLLTCDGLILLDGWESSRGARLERTVAEACGMPILDWAEVRGDRKTPGTTPYSG